MVSKINKKDLINKQLDQLLEREIVVFDFQPSRHRLVLELSSHYQHKPIRYKIIIDRIAFYYNYDVEEDVQPNENQKIKKILYDKGFIKPPHTFLMRKKENRGIFDILYNLHLCTTTSIICIMAERLAINNVLFELEPKGFVPRRKKVLNSK